MSKLATGNLTVSGAVSHGVTFSTPMINDWVMRIQADGSIILNPKIPQSETAKRFIEIVTELLQTNVQGALQDNKRLRTELAVAEARAAKAEQALKDAK